MKNRLVVIAVLFSVSLTSCNLKSGKSNTEKQIEKKKEVAQLNTLTSEEKAAGWQLLFNGNNFDGWKTFNGSEVTGWKVVDGIMFNSGIGSDHGGDIITQKQDYKDFELSLEWRIDSLSNSGVFYHAKEGEVDRIYESGIEYQLIDGKGWPTKINEDQCSGACYAMYPPKDAEVKPIGEWNVTRIVVKGTHVEHWLNGKMVVECELWSDDWNAKKKESKWKDTSTWGASAQGGIGLQDHGGLTQFRNMKIREL